MDYEIYVADESTNNSSTIPPTQIVLLFGGTGPIVIYKRVTVASEGRRIPIAFSEEQLDSLENDLANCCGDIGEKASQAIRYLRSKENR